MATFAVTTPTNIDALTGKTGGDVYNINGGTLTIDQDSRFGLNNANTSATAATTMGNITISATLGGTVNIDATNVWLIPFNTGSGTFTAGATLTLNTISCKVIGVYSAINTAPVLTGVASGFIKVKQASGTLPSSGTFTAGGYTFTITGAATKGWIGLEGDEASTITVPRLGNFSITGDWFQIGTTSGTRTTTYQAPTNGTNCYIPAIWVETGVGTNIYEIYTNAGSVTALVANVPTDTTRGKVFWLTVASGLIRLGSDGTNSTGGFLPAAGLRIRIPNVICNNTTTTARNAVALPNTTLATRYDFTTTGGGVINLSRASLNWYPSFAQSFSVFMEDVGVAEQLLISESASYVQATSVAVGQTAAQAQFAISLALCFAGGSFVDCKFTSATLAASGRYITSIADISGFTFLNCSYRTMVARANATTGAQIITRAVGCEWSSCTYIGGRNILITCTTCKFNNDSYVDTPASTTGTANPMTVWDLSSNCNDIVMSGLLFPVTNNHPYTALLTVGAAGCSNIKLRSIGTYAAPLSLGSANQTGLIFTLGTGAAAQNVKVQRVYTSNTRTNIYTSDNSSKNIVLESVMGDFADAPASASIETYMKGVYCTPSVTAQTAVYGTHWYDCFTSATAGRIGLLMNEATNNTNSAYLIESGAAFTSAGGLFMPTIGNSIVFETPYFIKGHTALANSAPIMAGGTIGNYTLTYDIDNGSGYTSVFKTLSAANLSAETGITPSIGIKLKIRIVTAVTNTTAITSLYINTVSTSVAQGAISYPLDTLGLTFTGLPNNTDIVVLDDLGNVIEQADSVPNTFYTYNYEQPENIVSIGFINPGYVPFYIRNLELPSQNSSIPVSLVADRNYF